MSQLHPIFNVVKLSLAPPDPIPSDAKVRFSSVLQPFLKNREPNRQSLCQTEPEPEPNQKNQFFQFCSVLKPVRTAEPILKPNLLYRVYLLIY